MNNVRKLVFVSGGIELMLPITPPSFEVGDGINIETINIHGLGDIRVAGYPTLDNITLNSFFPYNDYAFALTSLIDPWSLVAQFRAWKNAQTVVRFIITGTDINIPVLIESIRAGEQDGSNDVYYTLQLAEYRYVSTSISATRDLSADVTRPVSNTPTIPKTHTVVNGDTLRSIARKYYGDESKYKSIQTANSIKNANVIRIGAVLTLP